MQQSDGGKRTALSMHLYMTSSIFYVLSLSSPFALFRRNRYTRLRWSALNMCAYGGYLAIAKLLLEHGADLGIPDVDGETPVQIATMRGHSELVILFDAVRAERDRLPRESDAEITR